MGEGLLQVLLLVFFKGRIRRERIDGEVAVGERFMNNDGCPDVRLKKILDEWVGEGRYRDGLERSLQAVIKPVMVGRSASFTTVGNDGEARGRRRRGRRRGQQLVGVHIKNSFSGQQDDSAFSAGQSKPHVLTYPALVGSCDITSTVNY